MSDPSEPLDLDEAYSFAKELALAAGQLLLDSLEQRRNGTSSSQIDSVEKENAVDIVTKTDEAVERYIHSQISAKYPNHDFIGEESYSAGATKTYLINPGTPAWCVDPLDGTVNYVHGFPAFAVSIALVVSGRPVIGAISAPFTNQLFHGCEGRGAWLSNINVPDTPTPTADPSSDHNSDSEPTCLPTLGRSMRLPLMNHPILPLPPSAPAGCLFGFEWGKDRRDIPDGNLSRKVASFVNMATEIGGRGGKGGMVHGMRSLGSATLDLAYTAMGAFDIWWEGGCWEWDVAAGIAILREAGGLITEANPPAGGVEGGEIEDARLGSRLYLAIRPVGENERGESGRVQQERCVREVWKRVEALDYTRPGA